MLGGSILGGETVQEAMAAVELVVDEAEQLRELAHDQSSGNP